MRRPLVLDREPLRHPVTVEVEDRRRNHIVVEPARRLDPGDERADREVGRVRRSGRPRRNGGKRGGEAQSEKSIMRMPDFSPIRGRRIRSYPFPA